MYEKEAAVQTSGGRSFQPEGVAGAKAPKQEWPGCLMDKKITVGGWTVVTERESGRRRSCRGSWGHIR